VFYYLFPQISKKLSFFATRAIKHGFVPGVESKTTFLLYPGGEKMEKITH